jgi:hypothetical protein
VLVVVLREAVKAEEKARLSSPDRSKSRQRKQMKNVRSDTEFGEELLLVKHSLEDSGESVLGSESEKSSVVLSGG